MNYMGCVAAWWCKHNAPSTVWLQGCGCRGEDLDMRPPKKNIIACLKKLGSMVFRVGCDKVGSRAVRVPCVCEIKHVLAEICAQRLTPVPVNKYERGPCSSLNVVAPQSKQI